MRVPATPVSESSRLASLHQLDILDTQSEERFDRITRIATALFDVPIALVSLVDKHRQWFKSRSGLDASETPRDISFCGHAILGDVVFVVPDTLDDERFFDNPLVTGEPHIRFYAGCPLALPNGSKVGTLCIIDHRPRTFTDDDVSLLRDLAQMVTQELLAVQMATMDDLTMVSNRRGFSVLAQHALDLCQRLEKSATLLYFDLDNFKGINDQWGHSEGDDALIKFTECLKLTFRGSDLIGRLGGDEFGVLVVGAEQAGVQEAMARLRNEVNRTNAESSHGYAIEYSTGSIDSKTVQDTDIAVLMSNADREMYAQKRRKHKPHTPGAVLPSQDRPRPPDDNS